MVWFGLTAQKNTHSPSCWRRHSSGGSMIHGACQRAELGGDSTCLVSLFPLLFSSGPQPVDLYQIHSEWVFSWNSQKKSPTNTYPFSNCYPVFYFIFFSPSISCCPYTLGYVTFHWSVVNLPGTTPFKKTDYSSPLSCPAPLSILNIIWHSLLACCHNHCESMCPIALLCPENIVIHHLWLLQPFHLLFEEDPLALRGRGVTDVPLRAEHPSVSITISWQPQVCYDLS